jgi:hypothetical protein
MTFSLLTPLLLAGMALVALPIIIHLIFRRQPKHVFFPAFRFLKQRHRRSMRKLRLRHLLLLLLRMGLIALVCFALARPWLGFDADSAPSLVSSSNPVAAVLVFDTSVSMSYQQGGQTPLDRAKTLAGTFVSGLPQGSQVAVIDTHQPIGRFLDSGSAARVIDKLMPRARSVPVTHALAEALDLLAKSPPRLPVVLCVFSDRTAASWESGQVSYLRGKRAVLDHQFEGGLPSVYIDMSVPNPANVAITDVTIAHGNETISLENLDRLPFGVPPDQPVELWATVQATGPAAVSGELELIIGGQTVDTQPFRIAATPKEFRTHTVRFAALPPRKGTLQGIIRLKTSDLTITADDRRFWTLAAAQRRVLIVADRPGDTRIWRTALDNLGIVLPVTCAVMTPKEVPASLRVEDYHTVVLMNVARPTDELWNNLHAYVADGGGLIVAPGDDCDPVSYTTEPALRTLPGKLVKIVATPEGGTFLEPTDSTHEIMEAYANWSTADLTNGKVYRIWEVQPTAGLGQSIAKYDWEDRPAILQGVFEGDKVRGRVLLFTTTFYRRTDADAQDWNNYFKQWEYSFALPYLSVRHVMGAQKELQNFTLGKTAAQFWLPRGLKLEGYGLSGPETASGEIKPGQQQLALPEAREPGNYEVANSGPVVWQRPFSVNLLPLESDLVGGRPDAKEIRELFGENALVGHDEEPDLRKLIRKRLGQGEHLELLAILLVLTVLVLALENLLSNRFYRHEPEEAEQ